MLPAATAASPAAAAPTLDRRDQKRQDAEQRQRLSSLRKPLESRIRKLEEQMEKRTARKAEVDAQLAEPDIYDAANKSKLLALLADQAACVKDLEQLEMAWLELQEQLEAVV